MKKSHIPALLQPACDCLDPAPGKRFIDATFGGGGHSVRLLQKGAQVLGLDQDDEALQPALALASSYPGLKLAHGNFLFLQEIVQKNGFTAVDGILFDLGLSSIQLDDSSRGFSFQTVGPLDMRMDRSSPVTAAQLINTLSEKDLAQILRRFADIADADQVSRKIISARPLESTTDLARILKDDNQRRRIFQAIRIAVNAELMALESALPQALDLLLPGGRIAVISFHSLEDRQVKSTFRKWQYSGFGTIMTPRPIVPQVQEVLDNPRSKSSKLRVFQKNL